MIGRICLWIIRKALEHDEMEFGRIIGQAYVQSEKFAYGTKLTTIQDRIVDNWSYEESLNEMISKKFREE